MTNLAEQDYLSPARVRAAFAAEGVPLPYSTRIANLTTFSNGRRGATAEKLFVQIGARTGRIGFGPELTPYDERFENVLVTYGGPDEALLARVKDAVAALKH